MPEIDVLEQGRRRREKDKHAFELKISKRAERIAVISIIISLLTLSFTIYVYFGNQPKTAAAINKTVTQEIPKDTQDKK